MKLDVENYKKKTEIRFKSPPFGIMLFVALFEGAWELKRALMCLFRGKMYTIPESAPKNVFRGQRVEYLNSPLDKVPLKFM